MTGMCYGFMCPCGHTIRNESQKRAACAECGSVFGADWDVVRIDLDMATDVIGTWVHVHRVDPASQRQRGHICPICRVPIDTEPPYTGHHVDCPQQGSLPPYTETDSGPLVVSYRVGDSVGVL